MTASERSGSDAAPWPDDLLDRPTRELPGDTASLPPPDEAPTFRALGRFQITRIIGKGSTGIVYAAHDPRTDREVALKVLHRGGSRPPLPRLRREASTQARLSHPNVATIFELGIDGDDLFMVMELVPGRPLDQWLEERARRPEAIVEMFIRAGRGLAAIHHAGLVHHDFKPSNVLVGDDGRPRIIDFGLTRPHTELGSTGDSSPPNPEARAASIEAHPRVTRPRMSWGGGTLVFMAPEQHLALPVTASSDQFAFAVALHEALLGVHPFVSDGRWQRLPQRVLQGELADLPAGLDGFRTQVAQRLRRAMAVEPKDRWPSMDALADELQQTRTRPRWKGWRTRSLMLGALAVGVVVWRSSPTVEPCTDVDRQLDAVWSSERRESVREGLAQTGTAYALTTRQRVTAMVDRWSERWIQARHHACTEALAGRLSATAHAERTRCLDAHREALDARLTLFEVADSDVVQHAFGSISTLPPIDVCLDPAPATRDQLDSTEEPAADTVQATLGVVRALESTGRYAAALEQAELALDHAMEEGTPRAQAEARLLVGRLQRLLGKPGSAANLRQTFFDATALSLDEVAADAALDMISLASTTATEAQDIEAETWVCRAEALLQHRHDEPRAAQWLHNRGALAAHQERHEQAYALYRAALEAERRVWGDEHFVVARTLNNLGANSDQRGDPSASVRYYQ
ncbi:MAG: serine/threonine-protein kinase, partial [Deltaproteobacteria bacterium]|nr:serine/threonine-protein kinase [Deltaproteobacteria bacterium]